MKRILLLALIVAIFLSACSGSVGQTSPSLNINQTYQTTHGNGMDRASDYSDLIKLVRKAQANMSQYPGRMYMTGKNSMADAAQNSSETASGGVATNYSQTNIQVEGVDEADIIKTDGRYLYLVANNRLYVVDAIDPAALKVLSTQEFIASQETEKVSTGESPVEMYLDTDNQRLTLIVNGWINEKIQSDTTEGTKARSGEGTASADPGTAAAAPDSTAVADAQKSPELWYPYYNNKQYTSTRVYDLTNKADPKLVRQFTQEGYYISSRKINEAVYVVTNQYQYRIYSDDQTELEPAEIFPATSEVIGAVDTKDWVTVPADKIAILPDGDISNQMVLSAVDTVKDDSKPDILSILGSSGSIYASTSFLYVAAYNYQWDGKETSAPTYTTDIYRFKLFGAQISEAGKGSVPGSIINQFSMDEHEGYFRIATTTGEIWTPEGTSVAKNNVYVLDAGMKVVGKVTGLAPGESIKSVRFIGSMVYVVTFRNVDPLFVIDLSKPTAPKVLGQLKIPGYSTYLHPYADDMLLGFGYDVKNEGDNAYNMGLKVSLFDISDFNNPKELSTILLGGRGSFAEILYNHKTLVFSLEKNLIAFPATLNKTITNNPLEYGQPVFQGLLVLKVNEGNQLNLRGQVTHFDKLIDPDGKPKTLTEEEMQAFYGYDSIIRGAWIGNILFTFSGRQIRSTRLDDLSKIGQVELPGYQDYQKYNNGVGIASGIAVD